MSITYGDENNGVMPILKDGKQIGVITEHNGETGFRIFGEPLAGNAPSLEEAKKAIETRLG